MLSKKTVFAVLFIFYGNLLFAGVKQKVTIESATIFLSGAELHSKTRVNVSNGETEILLTNIAGNVNQQSLSLGASNGVIVQSAVFQNNFLRDESLSPRAKEIKDSIEYIEHNRSNINNEVETINEQLAILKQNRQVNGSNTGLSTTELVKMLDIVKARMGNLLNEKDALAVKIKKIDEHLVKLRQQLQEEQQKGFQPGGQLLVKLYSTKATTSDITVTYVVPNAGWSPSYDLRVDEIGGPVKLFYKAHVYQNSGVDWNKINISLSTGNPNEGAEAPILNPWYLSFYTPKPYAYQNRVISGANKAEVLMSYDMSNAPAKEPSTVKDFVSIDNKGINTVFDIELPYTIASDGQQHNVAVTTAELPATYRYYAVPKLDRDAFLQAQITGWEDLNLLPAPTNIFYEGTYVGQGHIDVRNIKDTMNLSLGRDKKIVVRRERDKELRSVKTIGTNVRETYVYKICARNTRSQAIDIVVMDQIPVSNDKDIEVNDREYKDAEYNEQTGAVTWKLHAEPGSTTDLKLGYTVKYPKGKSINL